jgi:hypothetical protein
VLALGVSKYENLGPVVGAKEAASQVERWAPVWRLRAQATTENQEPFPDWTDTIANRALLQVQQQAAFDDPVLFYFAGRASVSKQRQSTPYKAFLELADAPLSAPGLGSIDVDELRFVLSTRPGVAILDVCTDPANLEGTTAGLQSALPPRALIRLTPCTEAVGKLGEESAQWLARQSHSALPPTEELLAWLHSKFPDSYIGQNSGNPQGSFDDFEGR